MQKKTCLVALAVAAVIALAGCGGGGDGIPDSGADASAEGSWYTGDSGYVNSSYFATQMIIMNGTVWGVYGSGTMGTDIQGMLYGSTNVDTYCDDYDDDPDSDTYGECFDYGQYSIPSGTFAQFDMSGSAAPSSSQSFSGSVGIGRSMLYITLGDGTALSLFHDTNHLSSSTTPLSTIVGTYTGWTAVSGQTRQNLTGITISGSTLTLPADANGCSATGTLTQNTTLLNVIVFNVSLTFSGYGCALGNGTTVQGIALPPNQSDQFDQLEVLTVTSDGQHGFMLVAGSQ